MAKTIEERIVRYFRKHGTLVGRRITLTKRTAVRQVATETGEREGRINGIFVKMRAQGILSFRNGHPEEAELELDAVLKPKAEPKDVEKTPALLPPPPAPAVCKKRFWSSDFLTRCRLLLPFTDDELMLANIMGTLGTPADVRLNGHEDTELSLRNAFVKLRKIWGGKTEVISRALAEMRERALVHFDDTDGERPKIIWVYREKTTGQLLRVRFTPSKPNHPAACVAETFSAICARKEYRSCATPCPTVTEILKEATPQKPRRPCRAHVFVDIRRPRHARQRPQAMAATETKPETQQPNPVGNIVADVLAYLDVRAAESVATDGDELQRILDLRPLLHALSVKDAPTGPLEIWEAMQTSVTAYCAQMRTEAAAVALVAQKQIPAAHTPGAEIESILRQLIERLSEEIEAVAALYANDVDRIPACQQAGYTSALALHHAVQQLIQTRPLIVSFDQLLEQGNALPNNAAEVIAVAYHAYDTGENARTAMAASEHTLIEIAQRVDGHRQTARTLARRIDAIFDLCQYGDISLKKELQQQLGELQDSCAPSRFTIDIYGQAKRISLPEWWDGFAEVLHTLDAKRCSIMATSTEDPLLIVMALAIAQHVCGREDLPRPKPEPFHFYVWNVLIPLDLLKSADVSDAIQRMKERAQHFFGKEDPEDGAPTEAFLNFAKIATARTQSLRAVLDAIETKLCEALPNRRAPKQRRLRRVK